MFLVHTALMVVVVGVIFAANNNTETNSTETNTAETSTTETNTTEKNSTETNINTINAIETILVEIINSNVTFNTVSNIPSSPLKGFNVSGRTNAIDSIIIDANVINTNNSVTKDTDVTEKNDTNGDIPEPLLSDTNTNSTNNNTSLPVIAEANIDGLMTPSQYRFLKTAFKYRLDILTAPQIVRMAFHDCVGGCDGCLDLNNPSNRGLDQVWRWAMQFRAEFAPKLSMADVVAFLGLQALEISARIANNTVKVDYWVGRKDCDSRNGLPVRTFISHDAMDGITLLAKEFNLSEREAVALIGCHSLGGMHRHNSGFSLFSSSTQRRSAWDRTPNGLDRQFYLELVTGNWMPKRISNDLVNSTFWTKGKSNLMMLNADMAMYKNYTLSGYFDTPSCDTISHTSCEPSSTAKYVREFALDERAFIDTLGVAFGKMINGDYKGMYSINSAPDLIL